MEEGSLSTINADDLQKSFWLPWAKKIMIEKDEKWKQIPTEMMSRLGKKLMLLFVRFIC